MKMVNGVRNNIWYKSKTTVSDPSSVYLVHDGKKTEKDQLYTLYPYTLFYVANLSLYHTVLQEEDF